jgi:hypothetical protein
MLTQLSDHLSLYGTEEYGNHDCWKNGMCGASAAQQLKDRPFAITELKKLDCRLYKIVLHVNP